MTSIHFFETAAARSLLLFAAAGSIFLAGCSSEPAKEHARETVDAPITVVQNTTMPSFHSVAGTVRAETTSTLSANVVGTVARMRVAEGDRVRKGDVLVEIDARESRANADRVRAGQAEVEHAIESAAANARLAETTFRRYDALRERGSASRQEFDEARSRHAAAQAELARAVARRGEARAASAQAEAVLGYSSVRAPIDGVVTARFVDAGAQALPGVPLVSIANEQATRVDASVPEHITVRPGDRALVDAGGTRLEARVTRVQPSLDPAARSAVVQLALDRPLRAGTYVKVSIPVGARNAVTVPNSAVVRRGQLTSVFVVGADRVAHMRLITLGTSDASRAEVLSGIAAGESIVSAPERVRDGVTVRSGA